MVIEVVNARARVGHIGTGDKFRQLFWKVLLGNLGTLRNLKTCGEVPEVEPQNKIL
jgi:hypothetical protein